ncbi:MAG: IclR family transcriptional regulator, partial [Clostridiales bacterium]|nr:IclR family transcriptional regulator [Clostridiales bacterium]
AIYSMINAEKNASHVQSVVRAIQLLQVLADESRELSLTEIADKLGWPKSTAHGILATLLDYRFVDQSPTNGRYRLGIRLFEFGHKVAQNWDIRQIALPVMHKLNSRFGEMVQLATEDSGEVLYIEKVDSTHIIRTVSETGARLPMHCSALGKALLAYRNPAEVKRILNKSGMRRMTGNTITDTASMDIELAKIRKQGYAIDNRETLEGLSCVAAPIRDKCGDIRYAISVCCLAEQLKGAYWEQIKKAVLESAHEISYLMGYRNAEIDENAR